MKFLFDSFESWKNHCLENDLPVYQPVIDYEIQQKGKKEEHIWDGMQRALDVMRDAVNSGLTKDMTSHSGMVNNGAKKVYKSEKHVLNKGFTDMISRALAAKEVNSCMGKVVAAPTAGASGIMPGVLATLQAEHGISDKKITECMLVSAGIGLIIERNAGIAGAVGGCQAETGTAAAMAAGAIVHAFEGSIDQIFNSVGITIQCMLGLICDPVAGLVEVPCIVRNASAAAIAHSSAQIAIADMDAVIPVDECVMAMGEVGQSMEDRYKETALGGLANTPTGRSIAKRVLIQDIEMLPDEDKDED
ncbi:L-serine ammonia-lyase, iron-sulfur-dependent, subunit alpha [Mangrovivirga sp. M17]|uniref:L-serine dehydratase n=1 Tax=Mangrovivirga halotolerans TaxID=2993936 RepID=A0ABT3RMW7_9BACT|nr:L-serine ammonia-lyase, iron-sulfur-dependent, subunit alpha [Mangrovivirga halotolerans]MCX2742936.1 L-serine ammonia-lyase, iron-sulfur-dependent, subunit alpha [Mangrovivirga halotolerans]